MNWLGPQPEKQTEASPFQSECRNSSQTQSTNCTKSESVHYMRKAEFIGISGLGLHTFPRDQCDIRRTNLTLGR